MKNVFLSKQATWTEFGFDGLEAEEFKKRTTAVQLALFTAGAGVVYSLIYLLLGFPLVAYVTYLYIPICLLNLLYLRFSHRYVVFGVIQLGLIFLFPLASQLAIGGYVESSAVVLAAFLAPAGALLYASRSVARYSFYLFVAVTIGAAVWEYHTGETKPILPRGVILTFFAINLSSICGIVYFLLESFLQKQEELRTELRQSLDTLRVTQNQLIHAEKMASLGELTAGIAHEIQNPLNFVTNFSEVSVDLLGELDEERQSPIRDPGLEAELLADLTQNLTKITHHGQRASAIVRGMLEHSRSSTGQRTPTDLNALADEYLKLAYHGFRAKDKTFVAHCESSADPAVGLVNLIPQDMGRVLLNLINNAFYATQVRTRQGGEVDYKPTVTIATERLGNQVRIQVRDNGAGMPEAVRSKIFQPFFTTKPTGEGTGLGLSLAYDIITKGHNGTVDVESIEGEGTTFTVMIPG